MGVVAPMMNGIGGDLFALVYEADTERLHGINGSGWAPAALSIEALQARGMSSMPQSGINSVTVPGAVAAWAKLHERFGRRPFRDLLASAAHVADEGFPVAEMTAAEWKGSEALLRTDPVASRVFVPGGRIPRTGHLFRNVDLAGTYRLLGEEGSETFYRGEVARRILRCSRGHGGALVSADLAEYDAEWVTPLATSYRRWTIYELPPNGQGIAALMMLNILEAFSLGIYGPGSAETLHAIIEAKKLAYADLARHVADPAFHLTPETLLSKEYALERAARIDPEQANPEVPSGLPDHGGDTTYLSVADREGNMVSLIQSNFANFGSGVVPEGAGFVLQSRGGLFKFDPRHPNALAPRKRPLHTIIPGFMSGRGVNIAFGIMGGWNQAQAHAQFVSNVVDHGMNIQEALEAPRVTKLTFNGCDVMVESRVPLHVRAELAARGHDVEVLGSFSSLVGGGQSVMRDCTTDVNYGASDPRKDGAAVPQPSLP
ncbi:MAG: gamma-glutamyltransferase family protein [Vicinamibacterales bacterium]